MRSRLVLCRDKLEVCSERWTLHTKGSWQQTIPGLFNGHSLVHQFLAHR